MLIALFAASISMANPNWDKPVKNFKFKNSDIIKVIEKMGSLAGINYIVDPGVKGKITITQNSKITLRDAHSAFLRALSINGYTTIDSGNHTVILAARNAQRDNLPVYVNDLPNDEDRMVTIIYKLKNISADEVNRNLRIIPSKDGEMVPYPPQNAIILSDFASNIRRMITILKQLDLPDHPKYKDFQKEFARRRKKAKGDD